MASYYVNGLQICDHSCSLLIMLFKEITIIITMLLFNIKNSKNSVQYSNIYLVIWFQNFYHTVCSMHYICLVFPYITTVHLFLHNNHFNHLLSVAKCSSAACTNLADRFHSTGVTSSLILPTVQVYNFRKANSHYTDSDTLHWLLFYLYFIYVHAPWVRNLHR